jgi:hypothetical protein
MEKLPKVAQTAVAQTANRFRRKTKVFGEVFVYGFGISEKEHPDQLAASFGKFFKNFPQKLFALRAQVNFERVGIWILQAKSVVLRILTAAQIFCTDEVIALSNRDGQDPGTKLRRVDEGVEVLENPAADSLKNFLPFVHFKVELHRYGIDHSFVPPQQPFPRPRIT